MRSDAQRGGALALDPRELARRRSAQVTQGESHGHSKQTEKILEPVASLKGTGASAAEASTAIQALDATANDIECPNSVRSQCVFDRRALQAAAASGNTQAREEAMSAATALAQANV